MELNGPIDFRPKQLRKNITCGLAYIRVCSLSEEKIQLLQVYHFGDWPDVSRLKKEAEFSGRRGCQRTTKGLNHC